MARVETETPSCRLALQMAAVSAELSGEGAVNWSSTWRALKSGASRVEHSFATTSRYYVVLTRRTNSDFPDCRDGGANQGTIGDRILERWLSGTSQKALALDFDLSGSTISTILRRELTELGMSCSPSKLPLIIGMLARAARHQSSIHAARFAAFDFDGRRFVVVGAARPEARVAEHVTPAEYATLCLLAEGASYAEIAKSRQVSLRTVANQVGSLFRRLGISGRLDLQHLLVCVWTGAVGFRIRPRENLDRPAQGAELSTASTHQRLVSTSEVKGGIVRFTAPVKRSTSSARPSRACRTSISRESGSTSQIHSTPEPT